MLDLPAKILCGDEIACKGHPHKSRCSKLDIPTRHGGRDTSSRSDVRFHDKLLLFESSEVSLTIQPIESGNFVRLHTLTWRVVRRDRAPMSSGSVSNGLFPAISRCVSLVRLTIEVGSLFIALEVALNHCNCDNRLICCGRLVMPIIDKSRDVRQGKRHDSEAI